MHTNAIYCGDCQRVLANELEFPDNSVDLVYADPPFFSDRSYEVIWNDGYELRAFEDRWKGGIENYIAWMDPKLRAAHRVLKPTGSLYLHCDWHASHHLKLLLDRIFGSENFLNEIIWKRAGTVKGNFGQGRRSFDPNTDSILFYRKGNENTFHPPFRKYSEDYKDEYYKYIEPESGRRYRLISMIGPGGAAKGNPRYEVMGVTRYWRYSKERMKELIDQGLVVQTRPGSVPNRKLYLDVGKGVAIQTLWDDIPALSAQAAERLGYPTQKPVALMNRIVEASSNEGDIVLDPMCGCGTTIAAARALKRKWVGIDISPTACKLMVKRMHSLGEAITQLEIIGLPKTEDQIRELQPFEFQNWVLQQMSGRASERKVGDFGIDGWVIDGPVQVKQSEGVGRNVVDNFETAMRRFKRTKGYIVALSFGRGAVEEAARAKNQDGLDITLKTLKELLDEG
ncbi:MAG TPA: DNA methyltransferase [Thermoplasmata archaeon]|nr:DNA methyltransferase [Thermoplasmata archaeon]